jgi:hypothetical protein
MFRALTYLALGWLLLAAVPALAQVLGLSIMLPATTAVLVTHVAFAREEHSTPAGLAVALLLGYLEDLHQGAPVGTLALAHGLAFLAMRWLAARIALRGIASRAAASMLAVLLVDAATWATLFTIADSLGVRRSALSDALWQTRWHALATALAAHPVWMLVDRVLGWLRLDRPAPEGTPTRRIA